MSSEDPSRVYRGGSWYYAPGHARVAYRVGSPTGFRDGDLGVRLIRILGILEQLAEVEALHGMEKTNERAFMLNLPLHRRLPHRFYRF